MKPVVFALAGLILFGCNIVASDTFAGPPSNGNLQQQFIAAVNQPAEVIIGNDLAHFAVIDHDGRKQRLTIDGKLGPESDKIQFVKHDGPLFSRAGVPVLYARADRGRWRLVANGLTGPECDAWIDPTCCGANRTTVAYTAIEVSRKAFVAIDGQPGPTYADISCPAFSPDRTRIAYIACTGQRPQYKYRAVIDGRAGPEYDEIAIPSSGIWNVFSADNKHTAYVARLGAKWQVTTDGKPGPEFDEINPDSLAFSPDGRRIAYAARTRSQWRVVLDGRPGQLYDEIGSSEICFLSNSKDIAYTALAGSKWLAIIGDQPPITCDEITDLTTATGGRHVVFAGRSGKKWQAFVDGHGGPEYDQIGLPEHQRFWVSGDGKRVAYAGKLGSKWQMVVDGRPDAACDEIQAHGAPFYFSPDGKHTAYIQSNGTPSSGAKWSVVIDGQPGPPCDEIERGSFEFSDDGAHTAYAARRDDNWQVVVDNRPGLKYDEVDASARIFTLDATRVAFAARHGEKWHLVVNDNEGPGYDDVSEPIYSLDGRRIAYVAGRIVNEFTRDQSVVLDGQNGQPGPWYRRIGEQAYFCGSGPHVSSADFAHRSELVDGKSALGHESVWGVVFSPDGKHVAYPAGTRDEVRIIYDGEPGPAYHMIGTPVFSSDSKHMAYAAALGDDDKSTQVVVVDGQPGSEYDKVELPRGPGASCFSPAGKHTVYAACKGAKWHAVVDGHDGPAIDTCFGPGSTTSYGKPAAYASWCGVTWRGEKNQPFAAEYDQFDFRPLFYGAGGDHVAYVGIVETQARPAVVVDDRLGAQYDQVSKPVVSSDGRRVGYIAYRRQGDKRKVVAVIDGREGPEYDEIPLNRGGEWEPFSSNSQHSAYTARAGAKWRAIIDDRPGPEYDDIDPAGVGSWGSFFSEDGKRTAYFARRDKKWRTVIDGREGREFDRFDGFLPLVFSPDGNRVAYIAQWGQGPIYKYRAIIDGQEGPEYEAKWVAGPVFSPDSRRTAYVGKRDDKSFVVLDGKELAAHEEVDGIRLHFSPDSQRLAYIAYRGKEGAQTAHFVVDAQEGREYGDSIWETYFSPDSKHAAYIAINGRWQKSHTERLVVDASEGPVVGEVEGSSLRWSNDGRHLAYVVKDKRREWVVLDGTSQAKYALVSDLAFGADGNHLAYMARGDRGTDCMVILDGQPGPMFDEIEWRPLFDRGSLFTPDGRHVVYKATRRGKQVVVQDGQPGPEFDSVLFTRIRLNSPTDERNSMWPPRFLPDGSIQYPALTAGNPAMLYIVTQSPAAKPAE